jgi:hypothetical protein
MTSLARHLIPCGMIAASLVLSSGAMAANAAVKTSAPPHAAHVHVTRHVAVHRHYAVAQQRDDLFGQFLQSLFGGFPVQVAHGGAAANTSSSYDYSPPVDTSSSSVTEAQAASDAEVQAIQQMNDTNALNASMAAAEQQNDAANAATLQTEINAGM